MPPVMGSTPLRVGCCLCLAVLSAGALRAQPFTVQLAKTSWTAPTSNEKVGVTFKQSIGANEALRTGSYSGTVTFTLSTTNP